MLIDYRYSSSRADGWGVYDEMHYDIGLLIFTLLILILIYFAFEATVMIKPIWHLSGN